jgi:5-methylcytosine-specific restriction enzyme A
MKKPKQFKPSNGGLNKSFKKKRLYDTGSWVEYRIKFIRANPTCYACGESARVVDHIVAHKGSEDKFWSHTNMIPLCKPCHDYITGCFDKHIPPKTEEKMLWIQAKRMETETNTRVKAVVPKGRK